MSNSSKSIYHEQQTDALTDINKNIFKHPDTVSVLMSHPRGSVRFYFAASTWWTNMHQMLSEEKWEETFVCALSTSLFACFPHFLLSFHVLIHFSWTFIQMDFSRWAAQCSNGSKLMFSAETEVTQTPGYLLLNQLPAWMCVFVFFCGEIEEGSCFGWTFRV